jgi:hypothetical protein
VSARIRRAVAAGAIIAGVGLTGCTAEPVPGASPPPAPSPSAAASSTPTRPRPSATPTASATLTASATPTAVAEPTTTNTLAPPPAPTAAAPSTAGRLTSRSLPVPEGWKTIARLGGDEEGFRGNGTWVHARDPRYAARDSITVGCRQVTRDDYTDPTAALEGNYEDPAGEPGVGLLLDFPDAAAATRWFSLYRLQVEACSTVDEPVRTEIVPTSTGLVDRRRYPDSRWIEVADQSGTTVTLVILSDPAGKITADAANRLLAQLQR